MEISYTFRNVELYRTLKASYQVLSEHGNQLHIPQCRTESYSKSFLPKYYQSRIPQCRTESYSKSFLPSTIRAWKSVPDHLKSITSVDQFKYELKRYRSRIASPTYYNLGNRHTNIALCQLRNKASNLNKHLFDHHASLPHKCTNCNYGFEDTEHVFPLLSILYPPQTDAF